MKLTVTNEQNCKVVAFSGSPTILEVLQSVSDLSISSPCGGHGTCGKCRVELLENGQTRTVLACQTSAQDGMCIRTAGNSTLDVLTSGVNAEISVDSGLHGYGIACDLGTTTVVCALIDLSDGRTVASLGQANEQRAFGFDVIARIKAATDGKLSDLNQTIIVQLNHMISELCRSSGIDTSEVAEISIAGNTTMCHLLTGLDPQGLGHAPFTPLSLFGDKHSAVGLGLKYGQGVYVSPAVSGYVGGDITADLLNAQLDECDSPVLLVDIGTNGEMALGCGTHFLCCSTAAGPAFEGAQISCGMTAAPGAVSEVTYDGGDIICKTIGDREAVGICGSGLIDAIAVMLGLGVVDETGRMLDPEEDDMPSALVESRLFLKDDSEPAFRLTDCVCVTQADVRKLQLGKGAIAAGMQVLIQQYGIGYDGIDRLLIAGGFGSFIRPESAARIGLIPAELLNVTSAIGNAALEGAKAVLVSAAALERLDKIQASMHYIELSGLGAFNDAYMESMFFPEGED